MTLYTFYDGNNFMICRTPLGEQLNQFLKLVKFLLCSLYLHSLVVPVHLDHSLYFLLDWTIEIIYICNLKVFKMDIRLLSVILSVSSTFSSLITSSHFTALLITDTIEANDPNHKISTQQSVTECGTACSINFCNVFKYDKVFKQCVTSKVEKIKMWERGVKVYVHDSVENKPLIFCPETHPFVYNDGPYCCKSNLDFDGEDFGGDFNLIMILQSITDIESHVTSNCVESDVPEENECEVNGLRLEITGKPILII